MYTNKLEWLRPKANEVSSRNKASNLACGVWHGLSLKNNVDNFSDIGHIEYDI